MNFKKSYPAFAAIVWSSVLLGPGQTIAQVKIHAPLNNQTALPLDPAVRTGKLSNGFTYFIRHNEEPKNRAVFYLVNKVGSVLENDDQQGLAHFMEHMSFNGTKHYPKNELINYLQKAGVRFGADINAYTSFDETVYQLPLPSDDPSILKNGLQIMRDWAQEATLDAGEVDNERGVILEEKRLGKGAEERMKTVYWPVLLNNSRYASRMPIGKEDVLTSFKPETIKSFYHDWYRPDLQAIIVVGDIDVNQMEKAIRTKFSDLKNPVAEKARTKFSIPLTGKNQFIAVTDKEMTGTKLQVIFKHRQSQLRSAADYRASICRSLFNSMMGARIAELEHQANPPFLGGGAGIEDFLGGIDSYSLSVDAKPGELERGFKAVWREAERAKRFGFTKSELARAVESYRSQISSALKEKSKTPSDDYTNEYLNYFLQNQASPGIAVEYQISNLFLPKITLADISAVTKTYVYGGNRDILLMAPEQDKAILPNEQMVLSWIKAVESEPLTPFEDKVNNQPLVNNLPQPGTIVKETGDAVTGTTTLILSNGVKVVLKPTTYKNNEILFSSWSAGGTSLYSDADFQSATTAGGIIPAFGAGNYTNIQLDKFLAGKQLGVHPYISERMQGIRGGCAPKDLETALQLTYAYITAPRKDDTLFKGMMAQSKAELANRANDPESVYSDSVSAVLGSNNIRRTGPSEAKLAQIDLDRAYAIYKERFADASGMTFVYTGSINVNAVKPLLAKYLGALPATHINEEAKDLGLHFPAGRIQKNVYKGSEPKATVQLFFSGDFDYSLDEKMRLNALSETLEIRLLERLREQESGVYSPGAYSSTFKYPTPRYSFVITFGCSPQNVDKMVASALDEIEKLKNDGPAQINLDKYKAEDARTREINLKTNKWWLSYLAGRLQDNEPINQFNQYPASLKAITPLILKETANKYLSGKNYIRMVLLPETGKL